GLPSGLASQPSIGWMHQRLPTLNPPISRGCAIGEPASAVRISGSMGISQPSEAKRSRRASTVLIWATLEYVSFMRGAEVVRKERQQTSAAVAGSQVAAPPRVPQG